MKKYFTIIILLAYIKGVYAQLLSNNSIYQVVNTKSPNVSDLNFDGENISVNQYTGDPIANIDLFNHELKYTNINIGIGYDIKKVKPEAPPMLLGLGWDLKVGGAITREIIGLQDELIYEMSSDQYNHSYYFKRYSDLDRTDWNSPAVVNNIFGINKAAVAGESYAPDKFNVSYGNLHFSFYRNHKGIWVTTGNVKNIVIKEKIEPDYSFRESMPDDRGSTDIVTITDFISEFKITDDNGVIYIFGGNTDALEFNGSINASLNISQLYNRNFYVKTWFIKKIILPNAREINFEYDDNKKATYISHKSEYEFYSKLTGSFGYNSNYGGDNTQSYERNFFKYLTKISSGDLVINFHRSFSNALDYDISKDPFTNTFQPYINKSPWNPYNFYVNNDKYVRNISYPLQYPVAYSTSKHWYKMDSITVQNKNQVINSFKFYYREISDLRLRLNKLSIGKSKNNTIDYIFNYNDNISLPRYNAERSDHWGFFNNSNVSDKNPKDINGNIRTVPPFKYEDYREANIFSKAETLKSIILPTKGYVEFDYEPHTYSVFYDYNKQNNFATLQNGYAGGVRVKSIIHKNQNDQIELKKDYYYVKDYVNSNLQSSGIVTWIPKYSYLIKNSDESLLIRNFSNQSYRPNFNPDNSHISYTNVAEVIDNKQIIQTSYTNHDNGYANEKPNGYYPYASRLDVTDLNQFSIPRINFKTNRRGFPLLTEKFTINKNLLERQSYIYNIVPNWEKVRGYAFSGQKWGAPTVHPFNLPVTDFGTEFTIVQIAAYEEDVDSFLLQSVKKESFFNNKSLTTSTDYTYSDYLIKESTKYSDGKEKLKIIKYPKHVFNTTLMDANMYSFPVEEFQYFKDVSSGDENIYSHIINEYARNNKTSNLVLPTSIVDLGIQESLPQTKITYDVYDSKGNVLQYSEKGINPTTVIWSYDQSYPIAKIEGAKISDIPQSIINTIVSSADIDAQQGTDASEQALISTLDNFRNDSTLSRYQISTYTYNPLVGVTSITPPSGIREVYIYDSANRLKEIRQDSVSGKILKTFKYNYKK